VLNGSSWPGEARASACRSPGHVIDPGKTMNDSPSQPQGTLSKASRSACRARRRPLTLKEVRSAFRDDHQFPPILSLDQAATLAHLAPSTIKRLTSEGCFKHSVRRRRPLAFWRDRFVMEVMDLDKTRAANKRRSRKEGRSNETATQRGRCGDQPDDLYRKANLQR